jgi:hypothetical protein
MAVCQQPAAIMATANLTIAPEFLGIPWIGIDLAPKLAE